MSVWTRGAVASGCLLLTACSGGPVELDSPEPEVQDRAACEALVDDLPPALADEELREIEPTDALGAAYGDPAIVVVCGSDVPAEFNETSSCEVADGVGWYAPPEQYDDQSADVTMFSVTHRPVVELRLPSDYRPAGLAAALAQLAAPVKRHLEHVQDCV